MKLGNNCCLAPVEDFSLPEVVDCWPSLKALRIFLLAPPNNVPSLLETKGFSRLKKGEAESGNEEGKGSDGIRIGVGLGKVRYWDLCVEVEGAGEGGSRACHAGLSKCDSDWLVVFLFDVAPFVELPLTTSLSSASKSTSLFCTSVKVSLTAFNNLILPSSPNFNPFLEIFLPNSIASTDLTSDTNFDILQSAIREIWREGKWEGGERQ